VDEVASISHCNCGSWGLDAKRLSAQFGR
jgi:hypothetical protein